MNYISFALISCFLLTQPGCGRKQRSIFSFPTKTVFTINKLMLPSVENVCVTTDQKKAYKAISWDPIKTETLKPYKGHAVALCGYNVYALTSKGFVQKNPLTKKPLAKPPYYTKIKRHRTPRGYCIRPVFIINKRYFEGSLSACA